MKNSEIFLSYFNKLQKILRKEAGLSKEYSFSFIIHKVAKSPVTISSTIRHYLNDLRELSDLRNAIVHEYKDGIVLAEPNETALNLIEKIYNEITKPKNILSIAQQKVYIAQLNDSLAEVVKEMHKNTYSQVPVYEGEMFRGLLTENGITHWLGENAKEDIISIKETTIAEVLGYEENPNNYKFLSRDKTIYDAIEVFKQNINNPKEKIQAILITNNGQSSEKLLGIITIWDITSFLSEEFDKNTL